MWLYRNVFLAIIIAGLAILGWQSYLSSTEIIREREIRDRSDFEKFFGMPATSDSEFVLG